MNPGPKPYAAQDEQVCHGVRTFTGVSSLMAKPQSCLLGVMTGVIAVLLMMLSAAVCSKCRTNSSCSNQVSKSVRKHGRTAYQTFQACTGY